MSDDIDQDIQEKATAEHYKTLGMWMKTWVELDDQIRERDRETKELKLERTQWENKIKEHIKEYRLEEQVFNVGTANLRLSVSKPKAALKHETIQDALVKMGKDALTASEMTKQILDNRKINEREYLKRTTTKNK